MAPISPRQLRFLVVDDHQDSARVLGKLLQRAGYEVHTASGLADALICAAALPTIDVLVSDITLNDGNGCDLLPLLRERRSGGVSAAIAITGITEPERVEKCLATGFKSVLTKPVTLETLLAAVREDHSHPASPREA